METEKREILLMVLLKRGGSVAVLYVVDAISANKTVRTRQYTRAQMEAGNALYVYSIAPCSTGKKGNPIRRHSG